MKIRKELSNDFLDVYDEMTNYEWKNIMLHNYKVMSNDFDILIDENNALRKELSFYKRINKN